MTSPSVTIPASSANLGPGYDSLAVALNLHLTVRVLPREPARILTKGLGAGELPSDDRNLIWRAVQAYCRAFGTRAPDVSLAVDNAIPLERGLGSSAAAAVGGIAIARAMTRAGGSDADLIDLAADLEGHPDNAAAAVLGGLVVCVNGRARRLEPTDTLRPVVAIPGERQSTEAARGVLPAQIALVDAAANAARAAAVLAGLAGAVAWDASTMTDVFHEPQRLELMPASGRLITALREAGVAACLSGAGPSVLVIVNARDDDAVENVRELADGWDVRPLQWDRAGAVEATIVGQAPAGETATEAAEQRPS